MLIRASHRVLILLATSLLPLKITPHPVLG